MNSFNLKPSEIIYIDDRERDIQPAKELGMKTILFKNINQLKTTFTYFKIAERMKKGIGVKKFNQKGAVKYLKKLTAQSS